MSQKEIIIKIQIDRVLFNPQFSINIAQTNIPFEHIKFKNNEDIYWRVEMIKYVSSSKVLEVKIIDYNTIDIQTFSDQEPKNPIEKLNFTGKFDWIQLEPQLMSYTKNPFINQLYNADVGAEYKFENKSLLTLDQSNKDKLQQLNIPPIIRNIEERFWIDFNDAQFMLGYVSFKKRIEKIDLVVDLKIENDHLLAEFQNIRYWFAKKLNTKKFYVRTTITLWDGLLKETTSSSTQVDRITPELIDSIKYLRTIALQNTQAINIDKSLFTSEDIFSQIDSNDIEGNVFKQSEQDILDFLIEKKTVRNKKELAYLSGKKQSLNHPIRYTLHPNFGFLFLVEGDENNHFVWELLDSYATYIWTIGKTTIDIKLQFKRIEHIVNTIRSIGRNNYKRAFKTTHQVNDLVFRVIEHESIGSELVDGFPLWKSKLNEQLT